MKCKAKNLNVEEKQRQMKISKLKNNPRFIKDDKLEFSLKTKNIYWLHKWEILFINSL